MSFDIAEITKCRIVYVRKPFHSVNAATFTCMTMYPYLLVCKIDRLAVWHPCRPHIRYVSLHL